MEDWKTIDQGPPRDGRFILAFLWNFCGEPRKGFEERPVFLRFDGKVWINSRWGRPASVRCGDSAIALWIEQEPPYENQFARDKRTSGGYRGGLEGPRPAWKG